MARNVQQLSPLEVYRALLSSYGQQQFVVSASPFEVMIHAALMQESTWAEADTVVSRLRQKELLNANSILSLDSENMVEIVALKNFANSKAELLKKVVAFYERYGGEMGMKKWPASPLRALLLKIEGLKPETADAILLFVLDKPTVIANCRAKRVFERVGQFQSSYNYHEAKQVLMNRLPHDLSLLKSLNCLVQEHGERFCAENPKCHACPLDKGCLHSLTD